jgi:hypothetical protein
VIDQLKEAEILDCYHSQQCKSQLCRVKKGGKSVCGFLLLHSVLFHYEYYSFRFYSPFHLILLDLFGIICFSSSSFFLACSAWRQQPNVKGDIFLQKKINSLKARKQQPCQRVWLPEMTHLLLALPTISLSLSLSLSLFFSL